MTEEVILAVVVVAVVDWPSVALIGTVVVTALTTMLTYKRGTKTDDALNLTTVTQANFAASEKLVDQLQEEVGRLSARVISLDTEVTDLREQLRKARLDVGDAKASERASEVIVDAKDREVARLERRLAELEAELAAARAELVAGAAEIARLEAELAAARAEATAVALTPSVVEEEPPHGG